MGGFGASGGKSKSKSGTKFNEDFLNSYEDRYGKAPTVDQSTLPQAQSLFTPQVNQQISDMGIGKLPDKTTAPTVGAQQIGTTELADAPTVSAAQVNYPGGSAEAYRGALFRAQASPALRQFDRQAAEQRANLQSQVAGAGLGSSAAGIGTMQKQAADQTEARQAVVSEAADRAAVQYGQFGQDVAMQNAKMQQEAAIGNAERQQQVNLARAGFDFEGQKANAGNVLAGDLANASNYLQAIGLDNQAAQAATSQYLDLLGLKQADLARLDDNQRQNVLDTANFWLQVFAQVAGASRFGNSSSFNFGVSAAVGK